MSSTSEVEFDVTNSSTVFGIIAVGIIDFTIENGEMASLGPNFILS